jgi:site-specific DNA-methyltransferase (adenine-specific)
MSVYWEGDGVTLYHGDCLEHPEWWTGADVLVTDPPYGMAWKHSPISDTVNPAAPIKGDESTLTRDTALTLWNAKPALIFGWPLITPPDGTRQVLVWHKGPNAGVMGARYGFRRDIELIYLTGSWPVRTGRTVSSVLRFGGAVATYSNGHPHVKPLDLLAVLIEAAPPGVIADPFAGSGTTLEAARLLGRRAIGVEIDERYCEIAASRLAQGILI